jgi:hypothetical protein
MKKLKNPCYNDKEKLILIKKSDLWVKREKLMPEKNEIIIYTTPDGKETFEVNLKKDTVWLNLNQIGELFKRDKSVISRHTKNIFDNEELNRKSVVAKFATTATDGKVYQVDYYNLDLIISVGYRVNSKRDTQFRIWATPPPPLSLVFK